MKNESSLCGGLSRSLTVLLLVGFLAGTIFPPPRIGLGKLAHAAPLEQSFASLDVIISEVAWGGTAASSGDEWIELYNPGVTAIDLNGWRLVSMPDNSPNVTLSGTIPAGGFFLLERADDDTISDITADQIYPGDLGNAGEVLRLLAPDGVTVIDAANQAGGAWPAGRGAPVYASMERTAVVPDAPTSWATNDRIVRNGHDALGDPINGTPRQFNSTWSPMSPPTFTPTDTSTPTSTFTPYPPLSVVISEAAWSGTAAYFGDEWIELYNPGPFAVNLTGWRLEAQDGTPAIALSGALPAGSYFLLERVDDNVVVDVAANLTYNSDLLSDSGETLRLLAPDRSVVDTANLDGGSWPAGSGAPAYGSMERRTNDAGSIMPDGPTAWITNVGVTANGHDVAGNPIRGTPRQPNWAFGVTPTPSPSSTPTSTSTQTPTATPAPTGAPLLAVVINEVAWAGTAAASDDEWIELYNPGSVPIDLTDWSLLADDGSPDVTLGGVIPAGGFYLLERTDDNTVSDVSANKLYSGSLSNDGEVLRLKTPAGIVIDTANADGGVWPAGSGSPNYASMERRGVIADDPTAWITNTGQVANGHDANGNPLKGTPAQPNWAYTVTPTLAPTNTPTRTLTPTRTPTPTRTRTPKPASTPAPGLVVINEILPRPGRDWNEDGAVNVYDEFVEVVNIGSSDVNLKGWRLDDAPNAGASPYTLPSQTLKPGQRAVFYYSKTGISLNDAGGTVRLLWPGGKVVDAYTYPVAKLPERSWCRLPDGRGGLWESGCFPTPDEANSVSGLQPGSGNDGGAPVCLLPDTAPASFVQAECETPGLGIWRSDYWDEFFWEMRLEHRHSKWPLILQ